MDRHIYVAGLIQSLFRSKSISGILRADRADRARVSKRGRGAAEFERVLCY